MNAPSTTRPLAEVQIERILIELGVKDDFDQFAKLRESEERRNTRSLAEMIESDRYYFSLFNNLSEAPANWQQVQAQASNQGRF